jgi:hypothetical protein
MQDLLPHLGFFILHPIFRLSSFCIAALVQQKNRTAGLCGSCSPENPAASYSLPSTL